MNECEHAESLIINDGIPEEWDEDKHLHDYDYDEMQAKIEEHYLEEYLELRGIGLVE